MRMGFWWPVVLLLLLFVGMAVEANANANVVDQRVCPPQNASCSYTFHVGQRLTLHAAKFNNTCGSPGCYAESFNGSLALGKDGEALEHPETVITADGLHPGRLVVVAGPQELKQMLPGPAIEVYEGQEIVVDVINDQLVEGVTIHWHGQDQRATPWMDGVQDLTQCPIMPGVTMRYKFTAQPVGTHWWHSHSGMQRNDGLFGALIVRPRPTEEEEEEAVIDRHVLVINDFDPLNTARETFQFMLMGQSPLMPNLNPEKVRTMSGDFLDPYQTNLTFLVNGKGRHWDQDKQEFNQAPLTVVEGKEGETHRIRVINAGMSFPFRLSIDDHPLVLVASDGGELQPTEVESIIMWPGERYDFEVTFDKPPGAYWLRAASLVVGEVEDFVKPQGLAVLKYDDSSRSEPTSAPSDFKRPCSADNRCKVANCPFPRFPDSRYTDCLLFGNDLIAAEGVRPPPPPPAGEPIFLNFAFPGITSSDGSVNGQSLSLPGYAPLVSSERMGWLSTCNETCGAGETCDCPLIVNIKHNDVADFVFMNVGSGAGWAHPVHMHGYQYHVLKSGFVDNLGQFFTNRGPQGDDSEPIMNPDIDCSEAGTKLKNETWDHRPMCNQAKWSKPEGPALEGIDTSRSPLKDSINVPAGGYVWVRIKADNPGLWFVHCHLSLHVEDGMALVLATGLDVLDELNPIPPEFKDCKNLI